MDDYTKLQSSLHMLKWLAPDPLPAIRAEVEGILRQQVPGSELLEFRVTSDPQWLTGARKPTDGTTQAVLVRTGVAFEFQLIVREPSGPTHNLTGTYSWVGVNLDDVQKTQQRVWLDLGTNLATHGSQGELQVRLYFEAI
jgi:hypothetical protein